MIAFVAAVALLGSQEPVTMSFEPIALPVLEGARAYDCSALDEDRAGMDVDLICVSAPQRQAQVVFDRYAEWLRQGGFELGAAPEADLSFAKFAPEEDRAIQGGVLNIMTVLDNTWPGDATTVFAFKVMRAVTMEPAAMEIPDPEASED
jgi:hypothetical protein